jgi:hypothetical protein
MNEFNFVRRVGFLAPGDGFRKCEDTKLAEWRTAAGLTLTAATAPLAAALETSFYGVQSASSTTDLGSMRVTVPRDYDFDADELRVRFLCNSAGTTDAPVISVQPYIKREGIALRTGTAASSAAVTKTSATTGAAWKEVKLDGNLLRPGDAVALVFTIGAHTTDAINFYGVEIYYRSNLAFSVIEDR